MNFNDLGTQLLYTTVPIWIEHNNGARTTATSFIVNKQSAQGIIPFLVTNKHVVENTKSCIIRMSLMENGLPCKKNKGINISLNAMDIKISENADIATIPIGHIVNSLHASNKPIFFRGISEEIFLNEANSNKLSAIESIIFIGYPSGLYDDENLSPIIRQGITATPIWNNFQKQPIFIIDAGVFPGSSGSPVFIFNQGSYLSEGTLVVGTRLIFLGVLTETIQRKELHDFNVTST